MTITSKVLRVEQKVESIRDELSVARNHISDLQHTITSISYVQNQFKTAAAKSMTLLATRTERFVDFLARKDDEVLCLKAQAQKKIKALEKRHSLHVSRSEAVMYRKEERVQPCKKTQQN